MLFVTMDTHNWIYVTVICIYFIMTFDSHLLVHCTGWEEVVNAARCRVRCLSNLQPPSDLHLLRNKPKQSNAFSLCIEESDCRECLKPCSQPYVNRHLCNRICEPTNPSCEGSCEFLHQIFTNHPGSCPSQDLLSPSELSCLEECIDDTDCNSDTKCCSNTCGHTCQVSSSPYRGMPSIPNKPIIREKAKGGSIDLKWNIPSSQLRDPVLFIIEQRWNVGLEHSVKLMKPWQQIAQTTATSISIKEITPGYFYQFRVSAVNQYGSKGVSLPTDAYRLSREPDNPGAPRNLTEGDTIIKNNKMGVIIKWNPPKKSDLPVSRYKIFWSKKIGNSLPADGEHRHVLDGEEHQYTIPDLEPDTTYFVQIQAISQYGDQRLKSERTSLYITTFPLPHSRQPTEVDIHPLPKPSPVNALAVHEAFYQNGLLKANVTWELPPQDFNDDLEPVHGGVELGHGGGELGEEEMPKAKIHRVLVSWQPEVCITDELDNGLSQALSISTQENFFVIYDLRFECHYNVKVQTVSQEGVTGPAVNLPFPTPACPNVIIKGANKPDCPTNDPRTPESPVNLQHTIVIKKNNLTVLLSWKRPPSDSTITRYRVIWGQALISENSMKPLLDATTTYTKVLSQSETQYSITGLLEATNYVAKVQALSKAGDGLQATVVFTTPILTLKPINPPYNRVPDNHDNGENTENSRTQQNKDYYHEEIASSPERTNHLGYSSSTSSLHTKQSTLTVVITYIIVYLSLIQGIIHWNKR